MEYVAPWFLKRFQAAIIKSILVVGTGEQETETKKRDEKRKEKEGKQVSMLLDQAVETTGKPQADNGQNTKKNELGQA